MNICILGGSGYIGTALVPELVKRGHKVKVIDLCWSGKPNFPNGVELIKKDVCYCTEQDYSGMDVVVVLASLSNDPASEAFPALTSLINVSIPAQAAFLARKAGVKRIIHASSASVYGFADDKMFTEDEPVFSSYPYGVAKIQSEAVVMALRTKDFSTICLRKGTVNGIYPYGKKRFDLVVNTMVRYCMEKGELTVNNPNLWRPVLDIRDCVNFYCSIIESDLSISGIFNLASENKTILDIGTEVANTITELTGKEIKLNILGKPDFRSYRISWEKAVRAFGYLPNYKIKDTVEFIYETIKDGIDFNNDNYYNIKICEKALAKGYTILEAQKEKL